MNSTGGWTVWSVIVGLMVSLLLAGTGFGAPARPDLSGVQILAIAPFADEPALTRSLADYGSARLTDLLRRSAFQLIGPAQVAEAMARLGITRADLISPTKTIEVGRAVGADAVLTGRVTFFQQDLRRSGFLFPDPFGFNTLEARVDVDIRVLQVGTHLILFQNGFICAVQHQPARAAMECLVQDVSRRLLSGQSI